MRLEDYPNANRPETHRKNLAQRGGGHADRRPTLAGSALGVLQAEHLGLIVISKDLGVASPPYNGIERFLRGGVAQMVFELCSKRTRGAR